MKVPNWVDPTGHLQPGIPPRPPEGDGVTGMVAPIASDRAPVMVSADFPSSTLIILNEMIKDAHPDIEFLSLRKASELPSGTRLHLHLRIWMPGWVLFREFKDLMGLTRMIRASMNGFYKMRRCWRCGRWRTSGL